MGRSDPPDSGPGSGGRRRDPAPPALAPLPAAPFAGATRPSHSGELRLAPAAVGRAAAVADAGRHPGASAE